MNEGIVGHESVEPYAGDFKKEILDTVIHQIESGAMRFYFKEDKMIVSLMGIHREIIINHDNYPTLSGESIRINELSDTRFPMGRPDYTGKSFGMAVVGDWEGQGSSIFGSTNIPVAYMPDKKDILIVDDSRDMLKYLKRVLGNDYNIISACNGLDAMNALAFITPDLILTDVTMPGMNGYELTRKVKSCPALGNIPVIMVTGNYDESDRLLGMETGADYYLTKPFDPLELMEKIKSVFSKNITKRGFGREIPTTKKDDFIANDIAMKKIKKVMEYLQRNYKDSISREGLATAFDMSPDHLSRMFRKYSGMRIADYIYELRIDEVSRRLAQSSDVIIRIANDTGFESLRTFNRIFQERMGMTPTEYRKLRRK